MYAKVTSVSPLSTAAWAKEALPLGSEELSPETTGLVDSHV